MIGVEALFPQGGQQDVHGLRVVRVPDLDAHTVQCKFDLFARRSTYIDSFADLLSRQYGVASVKDEQEDSP